MGASERAYAETTKQIQLLGLESNVEELDEQGFTVLPDVLSPERIERAKAAILRRVATQCGKKLDEGSALAADFNGMEYQHYLLFDDPVFPEILLEPKPLALMHYLLGQSCVLSSMGSHFRGPGGMPLALHADAPAAGMTDVSLVANCNYALTPYTADKGALVVVPGSHRHCRQPKLAENWKVGSRTLADIGAQKLKPSEVDDLDWVAPENGVTLEINPGDAVIWHGNTWHGGWTRQSPGVRMNLAAYFCRSHMATQERRGDDRHPDVFERFAQEPQFAQLMGERVFNGWQDEGPDFTNAKYSPQGVYD